LARSIYKFIKRRIFSRRNDGSAGYHDAYYNKALILRQKISEDFKKAFSEVDAIITPTTPGPAFKIGEKINDPLSLYLEDVFTVPANIVGIPAISIPNGEVDSVGVKLPLGLQIMAPHNCEDILFEIGKKFLNE
jgi:aspartyl-tRNA(Asn)/glutamyl-tRNA(Gln) amidotransferase subunit A